MRTKDLYENSDEEIRNLEEGNLLIGVANHSHAVFTLIQNNHYSIFQYDIA